MVSVPSCNSATLRRAPLVNSAGRVSSKFRVALQQGYSKSTKGASSSKSEAPNGGGSLSGRRGGPFSQDATTREDVVSVSIFEPSPTPTAVPKGKAGLDRRRKANQAWWLAALAELRTTWTYKEKQGGIRANTRGQIEGALRAFRAFCQEREELEPTTAAFNEWVSTNRASQSKLVRSALSGLGQSAHPGWKKEQAVVQAVKEARPHHAYRKETLLSLWTAMKGDPRWERLLLAQQCLFYLALRRQDLVTITVGDWRNATRHKDTKTYELPGWVEEKTKGKKKKRAMRRGRGIPEGLQRDILRYQERRGLGPEEPMLGWVTAHAFGQHFNKWRLCFFTAGTPRAS